MRKYNLQVSLLHARSFLLQALSSFFLEIGTKKLKEANLDRRLDSKKRTIASLLVFEGEGGDLSSDKEQRLYSATKFVGQAEALFENLKGQAQRNVKTRNYFSIANVREEMSYSATLLGAT